MNQPIYLDVAAATPLDARVFTVMEPYFTERFYNPSSSYKAALNVRKEYEAARASLASWLGAKPHDIILTAGATESINLAVQGLMKVYPKASIAVGATEHQSVLMLAKTYPHTVIAVNKYGVITEEALKRAINDTTVLVTIGMINSEIGTKQQIKKLTEVVRNVRLDRSKRDITLPIYFHTDASQAAGLADLQTSRLGVDMMTLSATKIYGPKQAGLLYVRHGVTIEPLIYGGGQERGVRSGTENVAGVIGFAKALELVQSERHARLAHLIKLRELFISAVLNAFPGALIMPVKYTAPHIAHFSFKGIDAETLLFMLDERGVMLSTGAACAANKDTASHVLRAIGLDEASTQGSVRCSFGYTLSEDEVRRAAGVLIACVKQLTLGTNHAA